MRATRHDLLDEWARSTVADGVKRLSDIATRSVIDPAARRARREGPAPTRPWKRARRDCERAPERYLPSLPPYGRDPRVPRRGIAPLRMTGISILSF